MSRKKTGLRSSRGGGKGRGHSEPRLQLGTVDASSAKAPRRAGAFTMTDEARQTPQHNELFWSQNVSLRSKPLCFVSAGVSKPLKEGYEPELDNLESIATYDKTSAKPTGAAITRSQDRDAGPQTTSTRVTKHSLSATSHHAMDSCDLDILQNPRQCSSPGHSSSDEVILFQGRNGSTNRKRLVITSTPCISEEMRKMEQRKLVEQKPPLHETQLVDRLQHKKDKPNHRHDRRGPKKSESDLLIDDYIANMREHADSGGMLTQQHFSYRELGNEDTAITYSRNTNEPGQAKYVPTSSMETDGLDARIFTLSECPLRAVDTEDNDFSDGTSEGATSAVMTGGNVVNPSEFDAGHYRSSRSSSLSSESSSVEGTIQGHTPVSKDSDFKKRGNDSRQRWEHQDMGMDIVTMNELDSELEQQMEIAWKKDRLKKSQRKKQREELRLQGKLGGRSTANDLRTKYPTGISMLQVAQELKIFLLEEIEILIMPPMDKHGRKMVHELANKFNVKSKSIGRADQRRPTLYRTGRTMPFIQSSFDQIINRVNRRFIPRLDIKGKRAKRPQARYNDAATSYHDGEIIGAAAPELAAGNRGRAMLERMGWSDGTALGATNKGILQPVAHTMKKTKSGLA